MNLRLRLSLLLVFLSSIAIAQEDIKPALVKTELGESYTLGNNEMSITHSSRKQHNNIRETRTYDTDINSPKSVSVTPDGRKYYVNSLEGCCTVVYDSKTNEKLATIHYKFTEADSALWSKPSGLFEFKGEYKHPNVFSGKPVESCFSHNGRYVWIPFYRRSYDQNALEPSALAVIDTRTDKIVRLMETGALPKMIAASPDGKYVAVTQWGENTVGLINVESNNPKDWRYEECFIIDYKLKLDFKPNEKVNRDQGSGYALRGTCFTPDSRYLLVGCMGGIGAIAVIDMQTKKYFGRVTGMMPNVRHLVIHDGWLYLSINEKGAVQRIRLEEFFSCVGTFKNHLTSVTGWQTCKVPAGARTISIAPDGKYIFAACNFSSSLAVVNAETFSKIGQIPVDSYPVGLDISPDGKTVYVTSQGRNNHGGNAVNIYKVNYK